MTLFDFIRTSGGKFSVTKYTGHKLIDEDLNEAIPSVDRENTKCKLMKKVIFN